MDGEGGRETGTRYLWIPPCRKALERAGDYAPADAAAKAGQ
jgi:hypothetical protein